MSTQRQTNNNGINYEYKGYNICIRVEGEQLILVTKNKKNQIIIANLSHYQT